jgi:hypothetical protein
MVDVSLVDTRITEVSIFVPDDSMTVLEVVAVKADSEDGRW